MPESREAARPTLSARDHRLPASGSAPAVSQAIESMGRVSNEPHAAAAAARLRDWLLVGPAQVSEGPEAGGVAGAVDGAGHVEYVYGESTGYYLHWLASPHLQGQPGLAANAAAALAWCERRFAASVPVATRIPLQPLPYDWRNGAEFCFDLAMLVGGLVAASQRGLIATPHDLLRRLLAELGPFIATEGLLPTRTLEPGIELPHRWSTTPGPFLVKAAARILSAQQVTEVPRPLVDACRMQVERFRPESVQAGDHPVHPQLYFLEGTLALHPERAQASLALLEDLLALGGEDGSLPESLATGGIRRADIVAQALRLALVLPAPHAPDAAAQARLAGNLAGRVGADGAIAFQPSQARSQGNVWCAIFAEQALAWYSDRDRRAVAIAARDIV